MIFLSLFQKFISGQPELLHTIHVVSVVVHENVSGEEIKGVKIVFRMNRSFLPGGIIGIFEQNELLLPTLRKFCHGGFQYHLRELVFFLVDGYASVIDIYQRSMVRYILKYSLDCLTRADGDSSSGAKNT